MEQIRRDYAPGQHNYDDDYTPIQTQFNPRTMTGMDNAPRYKEMFVELEYMIENQIGTQRIHEGKVETYKGTTKKWQVLDDDCFDREEIEKLQAACDAPLPEQLEQW